jgi:galactitol-specific phosphotransferase system IIC component
MKMVVLILAIAMAVPTPIDEVVGGSVRLAMAFVGFVLIIWWIIDNDQKYNRIEDERGGAKRN